VTDLLISNARILDGSGAPPSPGSVSVEGDRIVGILPEGATEPSAGERIDAAGRIVCPGFIDTHSHSDIMPFIEPWMDSALRQGITTVVAGNCGTSGAPGAGRAEGALMSGVDADQLPAWSSFAEYLDLVETATPSINVASLAGHGTIRGTVMGGARRPPDASEVAEMRRHLEEALEAGAVGLSTGLVYAPGMYATTDEVASLARVMSERGGVYASHIRAEGELVWDAVDEAIEIGRRAGVPAHISHLKLETEFVWGRVEELLGRIESARSEGLEVSADQYPYTAYETGLSSFLPPWAPVTDLPRILADPEQRARLERSVVEGEPGWQSSIRGVGWERITVVGNRNRGAIGTSLAALAEVDGGTPFDTMMELLQGDDETTIIGHAMQEPDVEAILAEPGVMVGTDGLAVSPRGPLGAFGVHPRYYGTFPRILGRYVRERRVLPLETAIRKMTALAADRFGLSGRGRIREGAFADLVLFDPDRVSDASTFAEPHVFPAGIDAVVVNGRVGWSGRPGSRNGRVLRRA
jgi:dihydroorotase/N-acyl-D-amino-acid deacylase